MEAIRRKNGPYSTLVIQQEGKKKKGKEEKKKRSKKIATQYSQSIKMRRVVVCEKERERGDLLRLAD